MSDPSHEIWGNFEIPPGTHGAWQIGPQDLAVGRTQHEWVINTAASSDPFDERASFRYLEQPLPDPAEGVKQLRCAVGGRGNTMQLAPSLADRPVVVRAEQPFTLLPDDETSFFVGSPVWVRLRVGSPARELTELPSLRPSDTWFGPNTREGELCYASRTRARASLEQAPVRPARALTRIRLRNGASDPIVFERLKIPVGHLSLYRAADGRLWTNGLSVTRGSAGGEVECAVDERAPPQAEGSAPIEPPRRVGPGLFKRALSALIG